MTIATPIQKKADVPRLEFKALSQELNSRRGSSLLDGASIYQIWLRSFTPEGTLRAAQARLPLVAKLGPAFIQLCPVQKQSTDARPEFWSPRMRLSPSGQITNPYRIADHEIVDPEFGTEQDLVDFVARAHELGLKVLLDVVFFHVGPDSVLLSRSDFVLRDADGRSVLGKWNFPRLNFASRALRDYLFDRLRHWVVAIGVDGFRCDVSSGIPLDFWTEVRHLLYAIRPNLILLGDGVPGEQVAAFDLGYNPDYYATLTEIVRYGKSATLLRQHWEDARKRFPLGARLLHYSDNLDAERADIAFGEAGAAATAVLNFTLDGVPFVYNGQEIGDTTPCEIMARKAIRWDAGEFTASNFRAVPRYELYQRLFQLRRTDPALSAGRVRWVNNGTANSVVTFVREHGDRQVLVAVNLSNRRLEVSIDVPLMQFRLMRDLTLDREWKSRRGLGRPTFELDAFGFLIGEPIEIPGVNL